MRFRAAIAASWLVLPALSAGCFVYGEGLLEGTGGGGSGAGGTTTNTPTTSSTGQPCSAPEDCPDPGSPCKKRICEGQVCGTENLPPNTEITDPSPGDCKGVICDSGGGELTVENSSDFPDDMNACTSDSCELGEPAHKPKVGFACGQSGTDVCNDKGNCVECIVDNDCASKVCSEYICAPASCNDGSKNGSESDVDCGGSCQDCATGKDCKVNTDCKSAVCTGMICQPSCTDTLKNNSETDVDCGGGTCPKCADGKTCAAATDCTSGICTGTQCAVPTCSDGVKNGTETAVDCGGASCPSCPLDHLVINEVDYDQTGTDTLEFVEIYNATVSPVSLAGYKLVLVDGTMNVAYAALDLTSGGTLAAGQYLVVGTPTVVAAAGAIKIDSPGTMNQLQNGSPDGVALINDTMDKLIDAISYEGGITTADLSMWGLSATTSLVEGNVLNASVKDEGAGALCRLPNSKDTNNAAVDWALCAAPTPGEANAP